MCGQLCVPAAGGGLGLDAASGTADSVPAELESGAPENLTTEAAGAAANAKLVYITAPAAPPPRALATPRAASAQRALVIGNTS